MRVKLEHEQGCLQSSGVFQLPVLVQTISVSASAWNCLYAYVDCSLLAGEQERPWRFLAVNVQDFVRTQPSDTWNWPHQPLATHLQTVRPKVPHISGTVTSGSRELISFESLACLTSFYRRPASAWKTQLFAENCSGRVRLVGSEAQC